MSFEVTILGSNSALPAHGRHPTSQVINIHDRLFLVDCGEGTQMQIEKYRIRSGRIETIFISHLHGDHFFGLVGLITSYHLYNREKALTVYSPPGLEEIVQMQLSVSNTQLRYPLVFKTFAPAFGEIIFENDFMKVETVKMVHRVDCAGFVFHEKPTSEKNILPEAIEKYNLSVQQIQL